VLIRPAFQQLHGWKIAKGQETLMVIMMMMEENEGLTSAFLGLACLFARSLASSSSSFVLLCLLTCIMKAVAKGC
jgi:uncharacterized membrane protein